LFNQFEQVVILSQHVVLQSIYMIERKVTTLALLLYD